MKQLAGVSAVRRATIGTQDAPVVKRMEAGKCFGQLLFAARTA